MADKRTIGTTAIPLIKTGDADIDRALDILKDSIGRVGSKTAENIPDKRRVIYGLDIFAGTPLRVEHGLGTTPRSWTVCGLKAPAVISQDGDSNSRYLTLVTTADASFDIEVW
jgi:hypothetical protein